MTSSPVANHKKMPVDIAALERPFTRDVVLQVRTGHMKKMPGLTIDSGIDKAVRSGPVPLTFLGLDADEHDPTFHGGPDKAVHGCTYSRLIRTV